MRRRLLAFALALPLAPLPAQRWTLVEEQRFQDEDRAPFSRPGLLAVSRAGEVIVVDFAEGSLVRFSHDGRFIARLGRKGQGPGEFEAPVYLGHVGDTLWVADQALPRTTFFGPDWKVLRTSSYQLTAPALGPMPGTPVAILSGGAAVGLPGMISRPQGFDSIPVLHVRASQQRPDTLAMISYRTTGGSVTTTRKDASGPLYFAQPLGSAARVLPMPNGQGVVIADFTHATSSAAAAVKMARYGPDARLVWRRDWRYEPVPLTDAQFDSVTRAFTQQMPPWVPRDQMKAAIYRPKFWAPFIGGFVGQDGSIWLRERDRDGAMAYRVFTPDGAPNAQVSLRGGSSFRYATATHVWGWITEDELPVLVRWRIVKGR